MDISSLQVPRAGRSRFSKALPTPPGLDDRPQTALRDLPDVPSAPSPPKKNSVLITRPSTTSLRSKGLDSPLPTLPIMAEPPRPRLQAGPIPRKPVGVLVYSQAVEGASTTSKAMKRKSSISSLLSAYSRSSSDWAQRSSHESDFTKDSEPSYSPERERTDSLPPVPPKKSMETTSDHTSDRTSEVTSYTIINSFPPPPPLKDPSRARTPSASTASPLNGVQDGDGDSASQSPVSLRRSGSSRAGPEIWRRRASSKSDASLVIAELKLPGSNGFTASTAQITASKAEPSSTLPPPPAKTNEQPHLPLPPKPQQQTIATLPPRTVSLPGRNIRPTKQTEPPDEDEMKKLMKLSKLKELVRRGGGDGDSDGEQKRSQKGSEQHELQEARNLLGHTEAGKPAPPAKDNLMRLRQQYVPGNASIAAAGDSSFSPALPSNPTAPPPKDSGVGAAAAIARRPVGTSSTENPNASQAVPKLELDFLKKNTPQNASNPKPTNPVGTLPHPRQRQQQQPPRGTPAAPHPRSGPTSPTGGPPRADSTSAPPSQPVPGPMAGFHQPPGASTGSAVGSTMGSTADSPKHQPQASKPVSPPGSGPRENAQQGGVSPQQYLPPPRSQPPPFLTPTHPSALHDVPEDYALDPKPTANSPGAKEQPMSDATAAAVSHFPRNQNWKVECTVDGVWQPNPLSDRHYNCFSKHAKLSNSRNTHYPLACQVCGIADTARRCACSHCNLRICLPCVDLLIANGRDLRATVAVLKEQGRFSDWDKYPKRGVTQRT